jgi:hypothetical protein
VNKEQYANARHHSGLSVKQWIGLLAISQSTHDSIIALRKEVPSMAAAHIRTLQKMAMMTKK